MWWNLTTDSSLLPSNTGTTLRLHDDLTLRSAQQPTETDEANDCFAVVESPPRALEQPWNSAISARLDATSPSGPVSWQLGITCDSARIKGGACCVCGVRQDSLNNNLLGPHSPLSDSERVVHSYGVRPGAWRRDITGTPITNIRPPFGNE